MFFIRPSSKLFFGQNNFTTGGDFFQVISRKLKESQKSDLEFAEWLIENIGVAGVPGSTFFREPVNNYIRFHFAKKIETLDKALVRLNKLKNYRLR